MSESGRIIVIAGATATGKSDLAVALASEIGGEIINADSMQLYRGMDIGTAKLTMQERGGIPHHMIDILDVIEITGKPFTAHLPRQGEGRYPFARQFGLVMERGNLRERIDERVDRMWEKGLVDEVDLLIERGIRSGKTARAAIGYAQVIAYREGKLSEIQAREETKRATRAFARRQETWFSRDERITWIKESTMDARLAKIVSQISPNLS